MNPLNTAHLITVLVIVAVTAAAGAVFAWKQGRKFQQDRDAWPFDQIVK